MAATAVSIEISRIRHDGGAPDESQTFSNINATTAGFTLKGGLYGISVVGSTFGTVTLQKLGPDNTTNWLTAATAFAANGFETASLPPGTYRVALA